MSIYRTEYAKRFVNAFKKMDAAHQNMISKDITTNINNAINPRLLGNGGLFLYGGLFVFGSQMLTALADVECGHKAAAGSVSGFPRVFASPAALAGAGHGH